MPRNQGLRQAHLRDELRDGRRAGREATNDAEPVHVRKRLVDESQLAQLIGLEDGVRDRASDPGRGGGQSRHSKMLGRCINDRLYQQALMLVAAALRCQQPVQEARVRFET
jgi:hypothetical protein